MVERLSGLDATFLYVETPNNQLHVTGILVFDPTTIPGGYSYDKMKTFVAARLSRSPAFTRKIVNVPFNISHPVWVEDPDFDLEAHVHRVGCPSPGSAKELGDLAGEISSIPLDRNRPLWDMWFVEGLEGGNVGLVAKMHHATIDGVSGANLMMHLFDLEPDPGPTEEPPERTDIRKPSELELLGQGLLWRARRPTILPGTIAATAKGVARLVLNRSRSGASGMATPFTAPPTPFNRAITPHRKVAFTRVPLADVRAVKDSFGTTVNDVILAVCATAVRRWLIDRSALPGRPLVAGVPVSTRGEETASFGANLVSAMFVSLATELDDPVERLLAIQEATKGAKEEFKAIGADALQNWLEFSGPRLFGLAMRLYSQMELADRHPPALNFLVSNVPGPPIPLYFAGGRLLGLYPLGPVLDGMGLNITVLSYQDEIGFGFVSCRELIPDLWDMAESVGPALQELVDRATSTRPAAPPRSKRAPAKTKSAAQPGPVAD